MCGVVSILYGEQTEFLGREASDLLKKLEYRGYDSTGGAFISDDGAVILRKKVGAPSRVIEKLEIDRLPGKRFIGQVRWATYGSVTDQNAQPHEVSCRAHLVGAHNGNISNTDALKEFLTHHGHTVLSDNDGEMLVHLVEHHYAIRTAGERLGEKERIAAMKDAIRTA
ncbi:MAG TPA: class II glutamine amidotransferase, partial [bacterium]|nr:class II glutamine amidotransferase [bacterium]